MAVNQAVIKLNQIMHSVCVCVSAHATLFVSLSAHEHVYAYENKNILGLLPRQMKWPAWGGGQSSAKEKREKNRGRGRFSLNVSIIQMCERSTVII